MKSGFNFSDIQKNLPNLPGIYKYFDANGKLIYVGKAKNIRKRVSSYFSKTLMSYKTKELVSKINKIEFTIVDTEQDALFLENALIKEHQPKYNIELKDDKTYPYIVIKKEPFPRVFLTRRKIKDGSTYLGPFTSVQKVRELMLLVKQHIQLRTCKLDLSENKISKNKYKVCLEYHLGNCAAPCIGLQTAEDYNLKLEYLTQILKGNVKPVIKYYKETQKQLINNLEFEKAGIIQQKINHLNQYKAKSTIISNEKINADVFAIIEEGNSAYISMLMVNHGTVVDTHTKKIDKKLDETAKEVLELMVPQMRRHFESMANEIILPFKIDIFDDSVINVPKAGDRKKLLDLAEKNAKYFYHELKRNKILNLKSTTENDLNSILLEIKDYLHLKTVPNHIECFDNSNLQGTNAVAAMVCFKNGLPSKNDYRKFNIKTVQGINDFASMKEVVFRRYNKLKNENLPLPDLVIIDGGKGQLSSAIEALKEIDLMGAFTIIGLAKNEEEIFFSEDSQSIKLPWDSAALKLIRKIRDEVHRFGITFHRQKRSKSALQHELDEVKGLGKETITKLLSKYKSIANIKKTNFQEIESLIGKKKANILEKYLNSNTKIM